MNTLRTRSESAELTDLVNALQIGAYNALLKARCEIREILLASDCQLSDDEVNSKLLWIGDLQVLAKPELRAALCTAWNAYWIALWQFRSECPHTLFVQKDYLRQLPQHKACQRCGLVQVRNS